MDVRFIFPTSNICEHLFSIADRALQARRTRWHSKHNFLYMKTKHIGGWKMYKAWLC